MVSVQYLYIEYRRFCRYKYNWMVFKLKKKSLKSLLKLPYDQILFLRKKHQHKNMRERLRNALLPIIRWRAQIQELVDQKNALLRCRRWLNITQSKIPQCIPFYSLLLTTIVSLCFLTILSCRSYCSLFISGILEGFEAMPWKNIWCRKESRMPCGREIKQFKKLLFSTKLSNVTKLKSKPCL